MLIYSYAMVNTEEIRDVLDFDGLTNYFLVQSSKPNLARASIESDFRDLEVITKEKFLQKLEELFTTTASLSGRDQADVTGLIGQYAHGNEPSHHMAYLFNYAD